MGNEITLAPPERPAIQSVRMRAPAFDGQRELLRAGQPGDTCCIRCPGFLAFRFGGRRSAEQPEGRLAGKAWGNGLHERKSEARDLQRKFCHDGIPIMFNTEQ